MLMNCGFPSTMRSFSSIQKGRKTMRRMEAVLRQCRSTKHKFYPVVHFRTHYPLLNTSKEHWMFTTLSMIQKRPCRRFHMACWHLCMFFYKYWKTEAAVVVTGLEKGRHTMIQCRECCASGVNGKTVKKHHKDSTRG